MMKLLAPTNPKQLTDRALWFKSPQARKLQQEKGVEFGFELKGSLKDFKNLKNPPALFWGAHLPVSFATEWYYSAKTTKNPISHLADLKPDYVVLHGISLRWTPPAKEYIQRYVNLSLPEEYLKVLAANIELINELKKIVPLKIENGLIVDFYSYPHPKPYTYLHTGVQKLLDMIYLKQKTGVEIILDLEHLILSLNFLNRQKNYRKIPIEKMANLSPTEQKIKKIFGYNLKKNYIPYLDKKIKLAEILPKFGAKYFHLCGDRQDAVFGKKILSHGPIELADKTFRRNLRLILAQKPEVLVVETSNSTIDKTWNYLRPNETEISFGNMCQILLEEL